VLVSLWYVLHPCSEEFFRCEAHNHLLTQPSVLGPECYLLFANPSDATLGNGFGQFLFLAQETMLRRKTILDKRCKLLSLLTVL
jgi:hypothetical protein